MNVERIAVWLLALVACAVAVVVGGLPRPDSPLWLLALALLAALPLAFVFARLLSTFRPANRGWR